MKCIQHTQTNEIMRVSDETAAWRVAYPGYWRYVPKSVWKKATRVEKTDAAA